MGNKHTCEICAAMDGKVIDKKDYQPGVTVPPFHPNCRGTTCPWFDDMEDVGRRIARDNEGEVYYVPPDMTYREWEKTFQEGGSKDGLLMSKRNATATTIPGTQPTAHTDTEYKEIRQYAADRGVQLRQVNLFDGDIEVLRDQIDAIAEIREEYGLTGKKPTKVTFADLAPGDLAMTNREGDVITFDRSALRDRKKTNEYLNADNILATTDVKGIAYHEMGHVISKRYGEKGLEIARQAYYNIHEENLKRSELLRYLNNEISSYSVSTSVFPDGKRMRDKDYKEIIPEIIALEKTAPTVFSSAFVKLLKAGYGL